MSSHEGITLFGICPLTTAQTIIGGKWKLTILYNIWKGSNRFGALRRALPDCSQTILTKQLRDMEDDGLITRKVFQEVPPHVEYFLTESGEKLIPFIQQLARWGQDYIKNSDLCG